MSGTSNTYRPTGARAEGARNITPERALCARLLALRQVDDTNAVSSSRSIHQRGGAQVKIASGYRLPERDRHMSEDEGSGWILFASIVLGVAGVMRVLDGIWAIRVDARVPALKDQLLGDQLNAYGWLYLLVGIVLILAAVALYQRSQLARWIGIIAGAILTISAAMWLSFAPVWSLVYIFIGVFVIYGLAVYGGRVDQVDGGPST